MFFFLRYKLTEKLIVVSEAGNAERRSINLYSLNSTIHLHLQYFSFLFFLFFLLALVVVVVSASLSWVKLVLRLHKADIASTSSGERHALNNFYIFRRQYVRFCFFPLSYLRWHKFMMIFHVANQKSTQKFTSTWHRPRHWLHIGEENHRLDFIEPDANKTRNILCRAISFIVSISLHTMTQKPE